jgi:hypothetical protein
VGISPKVLGLNKVPKKYPVLRVSMEKELGPN